jgi:hypothetical protein
VSKTKQRVAERLRDSTRQEDIRAQRHKIRELLRHEDFEELDLMENDVLIREEKDRN